MSALRAVKAMYGMASWLNILGLRLIINKTLFLKEFNRCMT